MRLEDRGKDILLSPLKTERLDSRSEFLYDVQSHGPFGLRTILPFFTTEIFGVTGLPGTVPPPVGPRPKRSVS